MYQSHLLLDEMDLAPSAEWEPPRTCWRVVRVGQGQGYWLGRGEAREIAEDDVMVLSPQQEGQFRASQLGSMRLDYFRFCPELMGGLLTMTERNYFERLVGKSVPAPRTFPSSHPIAAQFSEIHAHSKTRNGLLLRCRLLQLVGMIFERELSRVMTPERSTLSASKRIKVLMQHLTEEEFLNASADELAAYCGCSLRHFSRLFLQTFSVSLRARQTELRLLKARRLLAETESRVVTVATTCGYRHLGVFNSLFKKRFAMTPTEWRRSAAQHEDWLESCGSSSSFAPEAPAPGRKASGSNGAVVTEK
jgi:AraC-like DNA-binding protein